MTCSSCEEEEYLEFNFKTELLDYQKAYPLPKKSDTLIPYYSVKIYRVKNDTIFHITRCYDQTMLQFQSKNIFEDEKLKPTVIYEFHNSGKNFIKVYPERKGEKLLKSAPSKCLNPYHIYKVEERQINFLKKEIY